MHTLRCVHSFKHSSMCMLTCAACFQYVQGNTRKVTDDVAALRPTLFIAVPRVLERIQAGIDAKVRSA